MGEKIPNFSINTNCFNYVEREKKAAKTTFYSPKHMFAVNCVYKNGRKKSTIYTTRVKEKEKKLKI